MLSRKSLLASFRRPDEEKVFRRSPSEYMIIALVVILSVWAIAALARGQIRHFREVALRQQLLQIRNGVLAYYVRHQKFPPDLNVLDEMPPKSPRGGKPFRMFDRSGEEEGGGITDPFGYSYIYNPLKGSVLSVAPCCQSW